MIPSDADPTAHLYCFDVRDGSLLWKVPFEQGIATTPVAQSDRVLVAGPEGSVAAVDLASGKRLWSVKSDGVVAAIPRAPSPIAKDGRLLAASNNGRLFALDGKTGAILWRRDLKARVNASLAFLDKTLYVGTMDGLYAIDPATGSIKKKISVGGFVYGTLVVVPPRMLLMLVKGEHARLVAFDTATRKIRWEQTARGEWSTFKPLVSGQMVIAGNDEKELCAFALTDGAPRWCRSIGRVPRGLGMSDDGMLYVGTLDGRVLAYHLQ